MVVLRPHLALTVTDVERAIPFYEALFGVSPEKARPGYAKFSVAEPAINLTLTQGQRTELGALNHARERLAAAGLATVDEMDTSCCYARQDKTWVRDSDGTPWEVFVTHADAEEPADRGAPQAADDAEPCGCAEKESECCSHVVVCCAG